MQTVLSARHAVSPGRELQPATSFPPGLLHGDRRKPTSRAHNPRTFEYSSLTMYPPGFSQMAAVPPARSPIYGEAHPLANIIKEVAATWKVLMDNKESVALRTLIQGEQELLMNIFLLRYFDNLAQWTHGVDHDDPIPFYMKDVREFIKTDILKVLQDLFSRTHPELATIESTLEKLATSWKPGGSRVGLRGVRHSRQSSRGRE